MRYLMFSAYRSPIRLSVPVLALLALLAVAVPASAQTLGTRSIQFGAPVDNSGNVLLTDEVADLIQQSGATAVRLNFKNPWNATNADFYNAYDGIVNRLWARGLVVIGLLSNEFYYGTQAQWQANNAEVAGGNGHNPYIDTFGYMAATVAQRYEGKVQYWEVWNEPNCWSSSYAVGCTFIYPSNFAALLSHVWLQMKYYNSFNVEVISGGLLGHDHGGLNSSSAGADYLGDTYYRGINNGSWSWVLANAGQYPLDHIGQHIYIQQGGYVSSSYLQTYLGYVRNAYTAYEGSGTAKKTFMTEIGWRTDAISESVQSSNLATTYSVMEGTSYVATTTWFFLRDEVTWSQKWGIVRTNNTAKPAWSTFGGDPIGSCGTDCTKCILGERPDVLNAYYHWGWNISCSGRDAVANDWCTNLDPSACNSLKSNQCSAVCGGAPIAITVSNADFETQSSGQYGPLTSWGPNGAWAYHSNFPKGNNGSLGSRFGYYSAGTSETVGQVLSERFSTYTTYNFKSWAIGGGNNLGTVPYQIGYAAVDGDLSSFVHLNTTSVNLDGNSSWTETGGVTYSTGGSGSEIGKQIIIRFGNGGSSDIWYDKVTVTRQ